jgi:hypothetical protein
VPTIEYVVTEFAEGPRVAVHIDGDKTQSDDAITVTDEGESSRWRTTQTCA